MDEKTSVDAISEVEAQLSTILAGGRRYVQRAARLVHPGLQPAEYYLLRMLAKCGPSRPSVIADHLEVDRSAVSRLIQRLDELGLVERIPDPGDRRAHRLDLTANARVRLDRLQSDERPLRRLLQEWDEDDVATLARLLGRLTAQDFP